MLIIWGLRTSLRLLGFVTVTCEQCHNPVAHRVEERRRVVSLFFVPLLPLNRKTVMTCTFCGLTSTVDADQVPGLLAHAHDGPAADRAGRGRRPDSLPGSQQPDRP